MLNFYATSIQKNLLAYSKRRRFLCMRQSALLIQTNWRAHRQRRKYQQILDGIRRFQAILRSQQLTEGYNLFVCKFVCLKPFVHKVLIEVIFCLFWLGF